ncbi:MAG: hypothetical protein AABX01_00455 [Candidatus Micrarchaeota archaeon]|mgnify:CR=1 FL=1
MEKRQQKRKILGFIGPLGDDIPAIFPIVAGILIFITALAFIETQKADRDRYLAVRSSTLKMSYILTEKGHMGDLNFDSKCKDQLLPFGAGNNLDFAVVLKKQCGPLHYSDEDNLKLVLDGEEMVTDRICSTIEKLQEMQPTSLDEAIPLDIPSKNSVILTYPVAVDCSLGKRGLGMIVVAGWEPKKKSAE